MAIVLQYCSTQVLDTSNQYTALHYTEGTKKNFEPIIQVLDFMNELFSSKFQVPGPGGALVGERGT